MNDYVWMDPKPCYQKYLKLNLAHNAVLVYRSSNNMNASFRGANLCITCGFDALYTSQDVIVVGDEPRNRYFLVGALTANRSLTYFALHRMGRNLGVTVTQPMIKPDETPEEVVVLEGPDWRELLVQYAEMSAKAMNVKPIDATHNLTGYCTWYYYYADVTEADFLENLKALKDNQNGPYKAQVVQIDDGYQAFQGDWLDQDPSWPTPLETIGKQISDAGMIPGIWTMPLLASTASRVFREHQDWFVKDTNGNPWIMPGWSPAPDHEWVCLDATRDDVIEHIKHVFSTFRKWGFRYFKMDGLGLCLPDGVRMDKNATPVSAFRRGLNAIREAVPDAILLGCGAPFMAVLGIVDSCRVSLDTSRYWMNPFFVDIPLNCDPATSHMGIREVWHTTLGNWWKCDRWFRADPDVIMARSDNAFYTEGEARISAAGALLTGVAITSDHLGRITPDRLALLGRAASLRLRDARPHNWYHDRWPMAFTGKVNGKDAVLLINDSEVEITYNLADYNLQGPCEELLQPMGKLENSITLPPHDAALVAVI